MYQGLKAEIKEIIEIVKECPEALQAKCFELLLEDYLTSNGKSGKQKDDTQIEPNIIGDEKENNQDTKTGDPETTPEDIKISDFHVKVQKLLNENEITTEVLNKLYYKENGKLMPFYETLKSTSMATCQIRLALLTAFENCFAEGAGELTFTCEAVRERCKTMKCYNASNFTAYFKNNSNMWDNFPDKYDGGIKILVSSDGKRELAKVLLDLADGER